MAKINNAQTAAAAAADKGTKPRQNTAAAAVAGMAPAGNSTVPDAALAAGDSGSSLVTADGLAVYATAKAAAESDGATVGRILGTAGPGGALAAARDLADEVGGLVDALERVGGMAAVDSETDGISEAKRRAVSAVNGLAKAAKTVESVRKSVSEIEGHFDETKRRERETAEAAAKVAKAVGIDPDRLAALIAAEQDRLAKAAAAA